MITKTYGGYAMSKKRSVYGTASQAVRKSFVFLLFLSFILAGRMYQVHAPWAIPCMSSQRQPVQGDCSSWANACTLQTASH